MNATAPNHFIPIDRFRHVLGALELKSQSFNDAFWLRFAAAAVVLMPDHPDMLAQKIKRVARYLNQHAPWFSDLTSSLRFAMAAVLVANHDAPNDFIGFHGRTRDFLREEGLPQGEPFETIAIMLMRLNARRHRVNTIDAARLRAIYNGLKEKHWWLTGPDDFPAIAMLAALPRPARELIDEVETCYNQLREAGFPPDNDTQAVANLLPVVDLPSEEAVTRFLDTFATCRKHLPEGRRIHYSSVVALCMLEQDADTIATRLGAIYDELLLAEGRNFEESDFAIAADLTFLDLVQFDKGLEPIIDAEGLQRKLALIHRFHLLATVVMADLDTLSEHDTSNELIWFT